VRLRDRERHVERMGLQMVLRVQRRRAAVRGSRVHRLLLLDGGHGRVAGGVGRLDGQSGDRRPRGQRVDRSAAGTAAAAASADRGRGRLVRVELQPERGGQRRRGHVTATAAVVLRTADGRRADPATPGIRRLVHRPGGVLTHWRRDGCGQPVPGTIDARPSAGLQRARYGAATARRDLRDPPRLPVLCVVDPTSRIMRGVRSEEYYCYYVGPREPNEPGGYDNYYSI